jgi:UDP-N-acetylglucosamine 2-epimerase (non-hydrolysing)
MSGPGGRFSMTKEDRYCWMKECIVLCVFGTRPEAIKMAPLVKLLQKTPGVKGLVCLTAQHRQMLDQVMERFSIQADYDLNLMRPGQTLTEITARVLEGMDGVLKECQPDIVLVHGDTTTSMAAAMAAFYRKIPVGHVEAGLRTYDKYSPFPEEMNRNITGRIATLHFAPTEENRENLYNENIREHVYVTGNTVIDALMTMVRRDYVFQEEALRKLDFSAGRVILLTAHRRENLGVPLENICRAVKRIVETLPDVQVVYPVHMNPAVGEPVRALLGNVERVHLMPPIDVEDMHNLIGRCSLVMTDSGGLQEEAPALGKPVVVLRTETERPEVVTAGKAVLAGVQEDDIVQAVLTLLTDESAYQRMAQAIHPYGDGHASEKIVHALLSWFENQ